MNAIYIAQAAAGQQSDPINMLITFGLIGIIFYFLLIRPQQKKAKEDKARQDGLKVDDEVVTIGGLHGIVRDVQEGTVLIEVSPSVSIRVEKVAIARVKTK